MNFVAEGWVNVGSNCRYFLLMILEYKLDKRLLSAIDFSSKNAKKACGIAADPGSRPLKLTVRINVSKKGVYMLPSAAGAPVYRWAS